MPPTQIEKILQMMSFILVGKRTRLATQVLQSIRSFSDGNCVVMGSKGTLELRWSTLCKQHILIDFESGNDDYFVDSVNQLALNNSKSVLIPFDCDGIRLINRVQDRVQNRLQINIIPIPDASTLDQFEDKWRFHGFCQKYALPVPPTRWIGEKHNLDFNAVATEFGLPFVVKPTNLAGSMGVQIVEDEKFYQDKVLNNPEYQFDSLIAQRFIEGVDAGVSLLSIKGQLCAFAIQQPVGRGIDFLPNLAMEKIAYKVCHDSQFHGVMNLDVRIEKDTGKVFLLESNPRFWATLTSSVECGLNFVAESVEAPSSANMPRQLVTGRSYTLHPLLAPALWHGLVFDRSARGRLIRAKVFDKYTFFNLVKDFPHMVWRVTHRWARSNFRLLPLK